MAQAAVPLPVLLPQQVIANPALLLDRQQLLAETWLFKDLVRALPTTEAAVQFCAVHRLLANSSHCPACNRPRNLVRDSSKIDGKIWRCPACNSKRSIRASSFFDKSHLSLEQILLFMYCWTRDWLMKDCNKESGGMSSRTQVDWGNFLRDVCQQDLLRNPVVIGGVNTDDPDPNNWHEEIVEIDESLLRRRKYNRGRQIDKVWVFGGVQRGTNKVFMVEVPDRTRPTLEPIIEEYIEAGTRIISDGWASYAHIDEIQGGIYSHDVIIHEEHYVDPDDPDIHTNTIENS